MTTKAKTTKGAATPPPAADETKAADATPPVTDDETPVNDQVTVQLSTRLERRIRAGVIVTREPTEQQVSEQALALLERDPLIKVKRL